MFNQTFSQTRLKNISCSDAELLPSSSSHAGWDLRCRTGRPTCCCPSCCVCASASCCASTAPASPALQPSNRSRPRPKATPTAVLKGRREIRTTGFFFDFTFFYFLTWFSFFSLRPLSSCEEAGLKRSASYPLIHTGSLQLATSAG